MRSVGTIFIVAIIEALKKHRKNVENKSNSWGVCHIIKKIEEEEKKNGH